MRYGRWDLPPYPAHWWFLFGLVAALGTMAVLAWAVTRLGRAARRGWRRRSAVVGWAARLLASRRSEWP